ncbi:MAG: DUF4254 domain-containing protein [Acidobacteriota bacterium]|nr:DUF4254 domain-containing protein [Acidobacteriota bacterium]
MVDAAEIVLTQDTMTVAWHGEGNEAHPTDFLTLVAEQHRANFDLWHEEDRARDPFASDADIAWVKRAIDRLNQRRNDLVEKLDLWLLEYFKEQNPAAPMNSETPGLIIDRLSILALRIYHMHLEAERATATPAQRTRNASRLAVLEEQRHDLRECLDTLLREIAAGQRRFKLYRQMKMYNDPELNPAMYTRTTS